MSGVDRAGGVFLVETQDERRLYHWPVVPAERGFVAFPPGAWGDEVVIDVFIYDSWYRTNSTELTPGTLHQGWSLEPENRSGEGLDFYLVQNLETPDETYHFPVGPAAMGYTEGFTGPDFDLWTKVEVVGGYYGERFRPVPLPADALQAPEGSVDI